jgi:hypothetical protein
MKNLREEICISSSKIGNLNSSVEITTDHELDGQILILGRGKIFFSTASRLALGHTQFGIKWLSWFFLGIRAASA